ncbi:MAG: hypothetical protein ACXVB9_20010 [Bdellovibrionota bacterium]
MIRLRKRLLALLLLPACAHLAQVEQGIRDHRLAGGWASARGDQMLIGCNGSFTSGITTINSNSRLGEVGTNGFTVTRVPLASIKYSVEEWPHIGAGRRTVMRCDGVDWVRVQELPCD